MTAVTIFSLARYPRKMPPAAPLPDQPLPDAAALVLLARRDPRGFDAVYASYSPRLHQFLRRLCQNATLADDLLQHTFLRLAERGPELRSDSNLKAWLFTVARNAFYDHVRSEMTSDAGALEEILAPSPQLEAELLFRDVERALHELHPPDRELLLLIAEGFTPSELAKLQHLDAAAIRQRLTRARSRLLAALQRQEDPQERERKSS